MGEHQILVLAYLFAPTQGLFNFLIFIRPRYGAIRREFPTNSRCWSFYHAVWHPLTIQKQRNSIRLSFKPPVYDTDEPLPTGDAEAEMVTYSVEDSGTATALGERSHHNVRFEVPPDMDNDEPQNHPVFDGSHASNGALPNG
jgi:hypothetical protein